MKQIEKASIGGYAFTLETEAAEEARKYLDEVGAFYSNSEISEGIEERMAELLRERTVQDGVVSKSDILDIINILGRPERIAQDEPEGVNPDRQEKPVKRLYRDIEHAKLAGVCGGIGAFFNFDPVILRVVFVALGIAGFFGFVDKNGGLAFLVPLIYIILWICIPAAKTARQRWEMRGDDGSAESVRRSIEGGASEVRDAIRQVGNSPAWGNVGRILEVIIGIVLLVVGVSGLFAGGLGLFGWKWLGLSALVDEGFAELSATFPQGLEILNAVWVQLLCVLAVSLPFLGMLYCSILLLFRIKAPSWRPGLVLFVVWLIIIVALAVLFCACVISANSI